MPKKTKEKYAQPPAIVVVIEGGTVRNIICNRQNLTGVSAFVISYETRNIPKENLISVCQNYREGHREPATGFTTEMHQDNRDVEDIMDAFRERHDRQKAVEKLAGTAADPKNVESVNFTKPLSKEWSSVNCEFTLRKIGFEVITEELELGDNAFDNGDTILEFDKWKPVAPPGFVLHNKFFLFHDEEPNEVSAVYVRATPKTMRPVL